MEMLCDNEPAIAIANNPRILKGARHFQGKYHYIREVIQEREIVLKKVHIYDNVVDPFTKPMPFNKHYEHAMAIEIVPASRLMVMKLDIKNMTLNEYLEYEAEKERRLWDNVRSIRSPNNYNEVDVDSFHRNKKDVIQLLIRITLHTTPPSKDYVASTTKPFLDELLEDKILNVAMVDEEADPLRDLEDPERLLVKDPHFTKIQSSTKPYKVDKEMKSPSRYGLKSSFPYPVANE
ncbi:hypothetical protein Tco_0918638, partial [Tanacetum coccineum]